MIPVIQKIELSPECFVERRLPQSSGVIFVEEGAKVRPFDFVAEVKDNHKKRLTAGVTGEVVKVLPQKAVLIKSAGVRVRGVFGQGEDGEGEIAILTKEDESLNVPLIDERVGGKILVCGSLTSLEAAKKAEALLANGVVCGSADRHLLPKINLPVLLIEGFGKIPLNSYVYQLLKKVESRHVFLSPDHKELLVAQLFGDKKEPQEVFGPLPDGTDTVFVKAEVGQAVQVFTGNHFGQTGKIKVIHKKTAPLPSGVIAKTVAVELDGGGTIIVPERNVGVIN